MDYIHNATYVYDATSQTFDRQQPNKPTLEQIADAFDQVIKDEFSFFASYYGKSWHVSLSKRNYTGVEMTVKGDGDTIFEAVETALNNFPKNPLDGGRWKTTQLAGPVEDATFTETSNASHS